MELMYSMYRSGELGHYILCAHHAVTYSYVQHYTFRAHHAVTHTVLHIVHPSCSNVWIRTALHILELMYSMYACM